MQYLVLPEVDVCIIFNVAEKWELSKTRAVAKVEVRGMCGKYQRGSKHTGFCRQQLPSVPRREVLQSWLEEGFLVLSTDWDVSEASLHGAYSLPFPWLLTAKCCTDPACSGMRQSGRISPRSHSSSLLCLGSCHHWSLKRGFQVFLLLCIIGFVQSLKPCHTLLWLPSVILLPAHSIGAHCPRVRPLPPPSPRQEAPLPPWPLATVRPQRYLSPDLLWRPWSVRQSSMEFSNAVRHRSLLLWLKRHDLV